MKPRSPLDDRFSLLGCERETALAPSETRYAVGSRIFTIEAVVIRELWLVKKPHHVFSGITLLSGESAWQKICTWLNPNLKAIQRTRREPSGWT